MKEASPAVVSIVISEQVPIVEQCPYNPFGNLSPEFQQFFGATPDMTEPCDTGKTQLQEVGGGSGFIISSDGLILTNKHVVSDASASYTVITNDGKKYNAKVLARDPSQDFAVVKISATGLPTVTLGDSDGLDLGQTAIAIGNALGQFSNTVSVGVVSGLERTVTASDESGGGRRRSRGSSRRMPRSIREIPAGRSSICRARSSASTRRSLPTPRASVLRSPSIAQSRTSLR